MVRAGRSALPYAFSCSHSVTSISLLPAKDPGVVIPMSDVVVPVPRTGMGVGATAVFFFFFTTLEGREGQ